MRTSPANPSWWIVTLLLVLSGCLPHSCQRTETRALLPADSVSRTLAQTIQADTLVHVWSSRGGEGVALSYPRSVQWDPTGTGLYLADARTGGVYRFDRSGQMNNAITLASSNHPYLAGWKQDTLVVLDPETHRLHYVHDDVVHRSVTIEAADAMENAYVYATHGADGPVVKTVRSDRGGEILFLNDHGRVRSTRPLEGPFWRHAGFIRTWGDRIISLCGYRPVLDLMNSDGAIDTLALRGFDSPMLSRSRLFILDEVDEPPLLYSSAATAGDALFVLNLRPGWLRIDLYDRTGMLQRVLTEKAALDQGYYPVDLSVYAGPGDDYWIAVAVAGNDPRLDLYRWSRPIN